MATSESNCGGGPHLAVLDDQPVGDGGDAVGGDGAGRLRRESGEHQLVAIGEVRLDGSLADRHGQQQQPLDAAAHHPLLQFGGGEDAKRDAVAVVEQRRVAVHGVAAAHGVDAPRQITDIPR